MGVGGRGRVEWGVVWRRVTVRGQEWHYVGPAPLDPSTVLRVSGPSARGWVATSWCH